MGESELPERRDEEHPTMQTAIILALTITGCVNGSPMLTGQQLHPRRLTVAEIQTNSVIPIEEVVEELMTESNETMTEEAEQDNLIPLGHLAIGTNEEKSGVVLGGVPTRP